MNLSLVAVFVSILFMGGIVERLFREFSITLVAAILISLVRLADADADAVRAAGSGRAHDAARTCGSGPATAASARCCAATTARSAGSLKHAPLVICLLLGVMALNVQLYIAAPKSFLPKQDTGQLGGFIRGDDGMSFQVMQPKIDVFRKAILARPGGRERRRLHRRRPRHQQRADVRPPQAAQRAQGLGAGRRRPHPRERCPTWPARACSSTPIRTSASAAAAAAAARYQYTLLADDIAALRVWGERVRAALASCPS